MRPFRVAKLIRLFNQALFLQGAKSRSGDVDFDLVAVYDKGLFLNIWLKDLAGLSLGEGHVVAVHFAFAGNFTNCHVISPLP